MSETTTAIVSPLPEEMQALRRLLDDRDPGEDERRLRRALKELPWVGTGYVAGVPTVLAVTGDGADKARRGLAAVLDAAAPERLLVVGVGGALSPSLDVEDVVVAREVRGPDGEPLHPDEGWVHEMVEATSVRTAMIVTRRALALSSRDKQDLYTEHGEPDVAVVDMESWFYARTATDAGIPWAVLRAVSDEATEDLPAFLNDCLDEGGSVDRGKVARHALFHPTVTPRLLEMRRRVEACSKALAEHTRKLLEAGR